MPLWMFSIPTALSASRRVLNKLGSWIVDSLPGTRVRRRVPPMNVDLLFLSIPSSEPPSFLSLKPASSWVDARGYLPARLGRRGCSISAGRAEVRQARPPLRRGPCAMSLTTLYHDSPPAACCPSQRPLRLGRRLWHRNVQSSQTSWTTTMTIPSRRSPLRCSCRPGLALSPVAPPLPSALSGSMNKTARVGQSLVNRPTRMTTKSSSVASSPRQSNRQAAARSLPTRTS